jgi:fluoroquinolone transport system permease protein
MDPKAEIKMFYVYGLKKEPANKVEGLALTKGAGILVSTPLAVQFLPWPWEVLILIFPTFWPAKVLFAKETLTWFAPGWMVHCIILWRLYRSFQKRMN